MIKEKHMTPQNALDRIKWDTPMKLISNSWQYETELKVLQDMIEKYNKLLEGMKALNTLDELNLRVILQAKP